ncbi:acetolactate synthase large subunit [Pueribacillus theae]|uniref:Acetolactate synthase n=1 Tax=Pueribacillus theae TaxID=2171751 RepID=A0A2U1K4D0_9BACI|nr:acetolactate synthase large subunit [Pueribacillus theae]PWA12262.1 acetolactate synthase large subunit [Pueribacillus theae]
MAANVKLENEKEARNKLSGASILIESLKRENVEMIFGYPGGAALPIYDALYGQSIKHVLTRHEQGAIHAAEGYARVSGKPGVVLATSGPGATNLVTGIADAMLDSLPLVVLTGQVGTNVIGSDAFQETDVMSVTMPITKHNYQVRDVKDIPRIIKEAFHIASTGRPGPVLIDIPKDIATSDGEFSYPDSVNLPGYQPTTTPNLLQIKKLSEAIKRAKKPVILTGAGVIFSKAHHELTQFVEMTNIPVVSTLLGLGAISGNHQQFIGMAGMHGLYAANMAIYESDLLINIGARFDDRLTGNPAVFAPNAKVAHIDIDPAEIGKIVDTQIPIVGDAKEAIVALLNETEKGLSFTEWNSHLKNYKKEFPFWYKQEGNELKPQKLIEMIHELTDGEAVVTTDVGQHQMWAAQYYKFKQPNRLVTSGGLGTMGFGLPAAIGAQMAEPNRTCVSIVGDAGFQMTNQELCLIEELNLPIKIVIVNNYSLGMVRQWQELFYEERYSESLMPHQPDFVKLAEAYGIQGVRVESLSEAESVLKNVIDLDRPLLIDCRVTPDENVYPMVPTGKGSHEMIGVRP